MLQDSVDTTDVECLDSSLDSKNGSITACGVEIVDEIITTSDGCNANLSQSPWVEQNETEMVKYFNNQTSLLKSTNIFEW